MTDLTPEQIEDIQTSSETNAVCAKRLGMHHKTVEKVRKARAHDEDGKFTPDDPKTPENEAYKAENAPQNVKAAPEVAKGARQAKHAPTTVYRDGTDGTIEHLECVDGMIPAGWHDSPADCENRNPDEQVETVKMMMRNGKAEKAQA